MTRAEILDCLTDRPCDSCKFHESGRCERWDCVFEEKPDDAEPCREADDCENEIADLQNRLDIAEYDKERWKEKVTALEEKLKSLSAEPCEDAISRTELLKAIDTWDKFGVDDTNSLFRLDNLSLPHYVPYIHYDDVIKCIKGMSPVTPKQNVGKWIYTKAISTGEIIWSECSVCGEGEHGCAKRMKFCPNCGAKMAESEGTE